MIKVVVNGYKGRMGQEVIKAVGNSPDLELVGKADTGDDLGKVIRESGADVVVDFTVPSVRMENFRAIVENGASPVVGTTGYTEHDLRELTALCDSRKQGAIIAPNFTISAVLMMRFAAEAAKYFDTAEIIELHHERKEDFPSGTAVKTAQLMLDQRKVFNQGTNDKVANLDGARGAELGGLHIHSVRLPGLVAHQEVILGALGQTLTIRQDSINRECYMPGVLAAVKHVVTIDHLVYGLENIL